MDHSAVLRTVWTSCAGRLRAGLFRPITLCLSAGIAPRRAPRTNGLVVEMSTGQMVETCAWRWMAEWTSSFTPTAATAHGR